ncbi:MAG: superoxide dismutase family protein [Flavisolibacter sp.]
MKRSISVRLLSFLFIAQFGWTACNNSSQTSNETTDSSTANQMTTKSEDGHALATITGTMPDTVVNGTVRFDAENGKVKMSLELTIPSKANKSVAVHIHDMGDCGEMGKHAGGHWNPTNQNHGKWGSNSFHSGDIGNVSLDANGKGTLQMETDLWSLGGDTKTNILDKTIIVHSGMDDFTSQPSGNSGERIGCGIIKKTNE